LVGPQYGYNTIICNCNFMYCWVPDYWRSDAPRSWQISIWYIRKHVQHETVYRYTLQGIPIHPTGKSKGVNSAKYSTRLAIWYSKIQNLNYIVVLFARVNKIEYRSALPMYVMVSYHGFEWSYAMWPMSKEKWLEPFLSTCS